MPCTRAMFLKVLVRLLNPMDTSLQYWRSTSGPGRSSASRKSTIMLYLNQSSLEVSSGSLEALLRKRGVRWAYRVLIPVAATVPGAEMCIVIREEQLNVDPNTIKEPWLDVNARKLIREKVNASNPSLLKQWLQCCERIYKRIGEYKPLLPALLQFCKDATSQAEKRGRHPPRGKHA